jgi:methylated-DNA-[protein]-cysteine S-methyltransferase
MRLCFDRLPSPIGTILLAWTDHAIHSLDFDDYEPRFEKLLAQYHQKYELNPQPAPAQFRDSLAAYFDGDINALDRIPVQADGTPFQQQVWKALRDIPPGSTITYGGLAAQIGRRNASRAVGLANGANPIAIIVPCHRVIGANGTLTGYGGGMHRKAWLLAHEGAISKQMELAAPFQPVPLSRPARR